MQKKILAIFSVAVFLIAGSVLAQEQQEWTVGNFHYKRVGSGLEVTQINVPVPEKNIPKETESCNCPVCPAVQSPQTPQNTEQAPAEQPAEPAVEQAPVADEQTPAEQSPVVEEQAPTVEDAPVVEEPSVGDIIQNASASFLNSIGNFIKFLFNFK